MKADRLSEFYCGILDINLRYVSISSFISKALIQIVLDSEQVYKISTLSSNDNCYI
jgi:hypothetical protein